MQNKNVFLYYKIWFAEIHANEIELNNLLVFNDFESAKKHLQKEVQSFKDDGFYVRKEESYENFFQITLIYKGASVTLTVTKKEMYS